MAPIPSSSPRTQSPGRRRGHAALGFAGVCLVVLVSYGSALGLAPTEHANGSCSGIGFGCTPAPRDSLLLLGFLIGLPTLLGTLTIGIGICALMLRWTGLPGLAVGVLSATVSGICLAVLVSLALFLFL